MVDDSNEHMMSVWDCARGTKLAEVKVGKGGAGGEGGARGGGGRPLLTPPPTPQSTNESVLSVEFNPQDSSSIITSGKSHVYFWTWSGAALTKKQGIFGVSEIPPTRGVGGGTEGGSVLMLSPPSSFLGFCF